MSKENGGEITQNLYIWYQKAVTALCVHLFLQEHQEILEMRNIMFMVSPMFKKVWNVRHICGFVIPLKREGTRKTQKSEEGER